MGFRVSRAKSSLNKISGKVGGFFSGMAGKVGLKRPSSSGGGGEVAAEDANAEESVTKGLGDAVVSYRTKKKGGVM